MGINMKPPAFFLAGITIAISGSIFANSVELPFTFYAGETAKASEMNANFQSLAESINILDERLKPLEPTEKELIEVEQINLPVDTKVTIGETAYTIVQFEFPRFDTDEIYIIRFPSPENFDSSAHENISVSGYYNETDWDSNLFTQINGFEASIDESYNFYSYLTESVASTQFRQYLNLSIKVGSMTAVAISFQTPQISDSISNENGTPDSSALMSAYPTSQTKLERDYNKENLRKLLSYIVIEKI